MKKNSNSVVTHNYSTKVLEKLDEELKALRSAMHAHHHEMNDETLMFWLESERDFEILSQMIKESQKFVLPENGDTFLIDGIKKKHLELFLLPYPLISLEYKLSRIEGDHIDKCLLLAWNVQATHKFKIKPEEEGMIYFTRILGYKNGGWKFPPGFGFFNPKSCNLNEEKRTINGFYSNTILELYDQREKDLKEQEIKNIIDTGFNTLLEFCSIVNCENITKEKLESPAKINKKREQKGKLPLYSYHYLKLKNDKYTPNELGGNHASPRAHLRRGHIRHLPSGKSIWVRHAFVGNNNEGFVEKKYIID